jgi:hypothetical protein
MTIDRRRTTLTSGAGREDLPARDPSRPPGAL